MAVKQSYFDIHVHATVKNMLTRYEKSFPEGKSLDELSQVIDLKKGLMRKLDDWLLHIIRSQSSIKQLKEGGVQVIGAAIANLEYGYADSKGIFGEILKSDLTAPLDQTYFDNIREGKISYLRLLLKELNTYRMLVNPGSANLNSAHTGGSNKGDPELHFIHRLHNGIKNQGLGIIMNFEGLHNLAVSKVGNITELDNLEGILKVKNQGAGSSEYTLRGKDQLLGGFFVFNNKKDAIKIKLPSRNAPEQILPMVVQGMWNIGMDLLSVNLTHLTYIPDQHLATHAFGLKLLKHPAFYPVGNGISSMGRKMIDTAYQLKLKDTITDKSSEKEVPAPILIDIKHLSLKSRQDFYAYREENGYDLPIMASHMGMTGYSITEWKNSIDFSRAKLYTNQGVRAVQITSDRKTAGHWGSDLNSKFTFNPWSINLMDEDIVEVLNSQGLIGISLDVRILGFQAKVGLGKKRQPEYLSTNEFQHHFPEVDIVGLDVESPEVEISPEESWLIPSKAERHPLCLCFNIVHVIAIGELHSGVHGNINPIDHICIGSDFDGLIEPLKTCSSSEDMNTLEFNLTKWLPVAAKAYQKENGGPDTTYHAFTKDKKTLKENIRKILYENGVSFLKRWSNNFK